MDLGIAGRTALVCASSQGLGLGCARALAEAGVRVVMNGRDAARLEDAAERLRAETGADIVAVAADVGTHEGRAALLDAAGTADILVNNNGGPPPRPWAELDRDAILAGLDANMLTPIALVQAVVGGMVERRFGRIVNITSAAVKMPLAGLELSSGARIGLTGFLAGIAREVAHANVTINQLLPGSFATARVDAVDRRAAEQRGISPAETRAAREAAIPARRLGDPAEFGAACAFLCSAQAGFITGQNLLIDGGAFPGVL